MMAKDVREELGAAVAELPAGVRDHVSRVVTEARRLAHQHDIDEERVVIAALGHDLYRAHSPDDLVREAEAAGLSPNAEERSQPILLHGPLAAKLMAERYGIDDAEVLAAARHHTTARAGMSELEKLLFVADKIEPEKARAEPALAEAHRAAHQVAHEATHKDLDAVMRLILDYQVSRALERGWPLHPDTVAARNELLVR